MVENDTLKTAEETAQFLHLQPSCLAAWRCKNKGPCYLKIGRAVFYRESAIKDWLKKQERDPAAKASAA